MHRRWQQSEQHGPREARERERGTERARDREREIERGREMAFTVGQVRMRSHSLHTRKISLE